MNILYVSTLCSKPKFKKIFDGCTIKPQQQTQKFHSLLSEGLIHTADNLYFLSRAPIDGLNERKIITNQEIEKYDNATYHYLPVITIPVIKHLVFFLSGLINSISWCIKYRKTQKIIICDILNQSLSISVFIAAKLSAVKILAIVTDFPDYMDSPKEMNPRNNKFNFDLYKLFCNYIVNRFDYYVLLTKQMNAIINPKNKPYTIIEGMVDINMDGSINELNAKHSQKVILYAGGLYEKYGIKTLLEAFAMMVDKDTQLWLFGSGNMDEVIHDFVLRDQRIKFFGVVPNEVVVQEQLKATLLVNPRPTGEEFTKYSFPSKNMEYMASGTPVITTVLPGMPAEYRDYVYLFEDESSEGLSKTLVQILSKNREELHQKGLDAKAFVLENKNNFKQAGKIIELMG